MAKRRRKTTRRAPRRRTSSRKKGRRKGSGNQGLMATVLGSMMYGGGREYLSDTLSPLTARVPLGEFADEAVMFGASWALNKGKIPFLNKMPITRKIGQAGIVIESARIGSYLADKFMQGKQTAGTPARPQATVF